MDKKKIYQKIKQIAHLLTQRGEIYNRADLSYDLKNLGVKEDNHHVDGLVWEAYNHFGKDEKIRKAFVNNEGTNFIVDIAQTLHLVEQEEKQELFQLLASKVEQSYQQIEELQTNIADSLSPQLAKETNELMHTITGKKGAINVQNKATAIFEKYASLVNSYEFTKDDIKVLMADFVFIRSKIAEIYRTYSLALIDIFGDAIKSIEPEIFDFNSVQWMDVGGMLNDARLEYDNISNSCSTLISEISENFSNTLMQSISSYKNAGNRDIGLIMAGLNMFNHYAEASSRTMNLKKDLLELEKKIKKDATNIKGDMGRILVIHKTINDLYLPKAEAFFKHSDTVLSHELDSTLQALYQSPNIKNAKQERDALLDNYKSLEQEIIDHQFNIDYYNSSIKEQGISLQDNEKPYQAAKNRKPSKPFFLLNWLTLGSAGKNYNRDIWDWNRECSPVIKEYQNLQIEVTQNKQELEQHTLALKKCHKSLAQTKKKLEMTNKKMFGQLEVDRATKLQMTTHLESMVQLLRLAKEILNSGLEKNLQKSVNITGSITVELPETVSKKVQLFTENIRKQLIVEGRDESILYEESIDSHRAKSDDQQSNDKKELHQLIEAENIAIEKSIALFEQWSQLQIMQEKNRIEQTVYDTELKKLQAAFKKNLDTIDHKSNVLQASLQKINQSTDTQQLKEGLLSLADRQLGHLTEEDVDQLLKGNKTIEF